MTIQEMFSLHGRVAVVTGGARDLGFDMAEILAEAGCRLVITSRSRRRAEAAAEKLKAQFDVDLLALDLDVREHAQVAALAEEALSWKGRVDILINNAGGGSHTPTNLFRRKPEDMVDLISINLIGTLYCCQEFGRIMVRQGQGKIINIASIAGMVGRDRRMYDRNSLDEQSIDYAGAKAGIIGITKDLAGLLSPLGVYVNAISPGGFQRGQPPQFIKAYSDRTPLGRMGRDGVDLKGAALFLASAASDYVTGHNLVVDGGFTIWH